MRGGGGDAEYSNRDDGEEEREKLDATVNADPVDSRAYIFRRKRDQLWMDTTLASIT